MASTAACGAVRPRALVGPNAEVTKALTCRHKGHTPVPWKEALPHGCAARVPCSCSPRLVVCDRSGGWQVISSTGACAVRWGPQVSIEDGPQLVGRARPGQAQRYLRYPLRRDTGVHTSCILNARSR